MAKRKVVTHRQRLAARLLLEGMSGVRALRQAGFGRSYSRNLGRALKRSWGLRQALREEKKDMGWYPSLRPKRRKRYDHRRVVAAINRYALPEEPDLPPGLAPAPPSVREEFKKMEQRLHPPPAPLHTCPLCGRGTDRLVLGTWEDRLVYVCSKCSIF
jgi:hypothetical protein